MGQVDDFLFGQAWTDEEHSVVCGQEGEVAFFVMV